MNVFEKALVKSKKDKYDVLPSGNYRMVIIGGEVHLKKTYKSLIDRTLNPHIFINDGKSKNNQ
jgi:hypothetical protein